MSHKPFRVTVFLVVSTALLSFGYSLPDVKAQAPNDKTNVWVNAPAVQTGPLYTQPVDPNGKILLSSWRDPDGSDNDQYVWDEFTLQSDVTITEINWFGVYDPSRFGAGGPVIDFSFSIHSSTAADTEPDVANPPLVHYQTGGNAGETSIGTVGGNAMYSYSFSLPTPFIASAGVKYWVQIEASQQGSIPDWCFAGGSGGSGNHYLKTSGAGGDTMYRFAPGDAAFTLLGPITAPNTPTPVVAITSTPSDTPTTMPGDTPTPTPGPQIPTCFGSIFTFMMLVVFFSDFRTPRH